MTTTKTNADKSTKSSSHSTSFSAAANNNNNASSPKLMIHRLSDRLSHSFSAQRRSLTSNVSSFLGSAISDSRTPFEKLWNRIARQSSTLNEITDTQSVVSGTRHSSSSRSHSKTNCCCPHLRSTLYTAFHHRRIVVAMTLVFISICSLGWTVVILLGQRSTIVTTNDYSDKTVAMAYLIDSELQKASLPLFTMEEMVKQFPEFRNLKQFGEEEEEQCHNDTLAETYGRVGESMKNSAGMEGVLMDILLEPRGFVCLSLAGSYETGYYERSELEEGEQVVMEGPEGLTSSEKGERMMTVRNPIYLNDNKTNEDYFWGYTTVVLNWTGIEDQLDLYGYFNELGMSFELLRWDDDNEEEEEEEGKEKEGLMTTILSSSTYPHPHPTPPLITTPLSPYSTPWTLYSTPRSNPPIPFVIWGTVSVTLIALLSSLATAIILVNRLSHTNLLYRIMPRHVINRLRRGDTIIEKYDCATLCFLDIVSFTTMSGTMSAEEVFLMLKKLYTAFDELAEKYGVFNVETIGDAYIVVGGHEGDVVDPAKGAANVARFALGVMEVTSENQFHESWDVRVRAGLASGLVVGGVVGNALRPKYTLFGDTVVLGDTLESGSLPGGVLCSERTGKLLKRCEDWEFGLELRKGGKELVYNDKVIKTTYWVNSVKEKKAVTSAANPNRGSFNLTSVVIHNNFEESHLNEYDDDSAVTDDFEDVADDDLGHLTDWNATDAEKDYSEYDNDDTSRPREKFRRGSSVASREIPDDISSLADNDGSSDKNLEKRGKFRRGSSVASREIPKDIIDPDRHADVSSDKNLEKRGKFRRGSSVASREIPKDIIDPDRHADVSSDKNLEKRGKFRRGSSVASREIPKDIHKIQHDNNNNNNNKEIDEFDDDDDDIIDAAAYDDSDNETTPTNNQQSQPQQQRMNHPPTKSKFRRGSGVACQNVPHNKNPNRFRRGSGVAIGELPPGVTPLQPPPTPNDGDDDNNINNNNNSSPYPPQSSAFKLKDVLFHHPTTSTAKRESSQQQQGIDTSNHSSKSNGELTLGTATSHGPDVTEDEASIYSKESAAFRNYWRRLAKNNDAWDKSNIDLPQSNTTSLRSQMKNAIQSFVRSLRSTIQVAIGYKRIPLVSLLTFALLCASGVSIVLVFANKYTAEQKDFVTEKSVAFDRFLNSELQKSLLPLFAVSELVKDLPSIYGNLPHAIEPLPLEGRGPNNHTYRNVTTVCSNNITVQDSFYEMAASIKKAANMSGILVNVQLAPYGVLCLTYPLNNTEDFDDGMFLDTSGAIGIDLLNDRTRKASSQLAVVENRVTIQGPITLAQGNSSVVDEAIIARYPVDTGMHTIVIEGVEYSFWGFTITLMDWDKLKEMFGLEEFFARDGMEFRMTRTDTLVNKTTNETYYKDVVIAESTNANVLHNDNSISVPMDTADNGYILTAGYESGFAPPWFNGAIALVVIGSIFISSLLLMVLVTNKQHKVLLYRMMPKRVIQKVQKREAMVERDSLATCFFSHIIGFTTLSGQMKPTEFMVMLNQVYEAFDELTIKHQVSKVETIGAHYIVTAPGPEKCIGLPGASRIALFALDAVSFVQNYRYKDDMRIFIRAGIASGPMVSGITGSAVPKFTIFGDTVNMTSRMESTSKSMKIQCCERTQEMLKKSNEYDFDMEERMENGERGIMVKGKGLKYTWWIYKAVQRTEGGMSAAASKTALHKIDDPVLAANVAWNQSQCGITKRDVKEDAEDGGGLPSKGGTRRRVSFSEQKEGEVMMPEVHV